MIYMKMIKICNIKIPITLGNSLDYFDLVQFYPLGKGSTVIFKVIGIAVFLCYLQKETVIKGCFEVNLHLKIQKK